MHVYLSLPIRSSAQMVLLRNSQRESNIGGKMKLRWLGPYFIHEVLGKGVYCLSNLKSGVVLKTAANQCRLKLYTKPPGVSDWEVTHS